MTKIAEELDARIRTLDPIRARYLEDLVRDALSRAELFAVISGGSDWPPGYFERTSGALVGEQIDRLSQGDLPLRDEW